MCIKNKFNSDQKTIEGFGYEWGKFDQEKLSENELDTLFQQYFKIFPWDKIFKSSVGFDMGCGSGRWAKYIAPKVCLLHCIDASEAALNVAKKKLCVFTNCNFHHASVENIPLENNSMDFGYSLGVLHHIPDTFNGIKECAAKLKKGAPFLVYLYYAFDNRSVFYRYLWKISDIMRMLISRFPLKLRYIISQIIAILIYLPLARFSLFIEKYGVVVESFPLAAYRNRSFYIMRNDAFDRFGTRLEKRFSALQIQDMLRSAGFKDIILNNSPPFWCAVGIKN